MVILVHTSQMYDIPTVLEKICEFGQMGCQLFLVISGFTLMSSWRKRKLSFRQFYINRWLSIAPGYWIAIIIYFTLNILKNYVGKGIAIDLFSLGALVNATLLHGFFPQFNNNIVPGGWYIGTSIIIYLIFPFIATLICSNKFKNHQIFHSYLLPIGMSLILIFALFIVSYLGYPVDLNNNTFLYFSVLNQLPCAACGIILSSRYEEGKINKNRWVMLISIALFVMSYITFHSNFAYKYYLSPILSALSYSFLIEWLLAHEIEKGPNWLCIMGKESFGIYLLHPIFAYQLSAIVKRVLNADDIFLFFIMYVVIIVMSLFFGKFCISQFSNKIKRFKF